jgi:opacity protein-like surface antigen
VGDLDGLEYVVGLGLNLDRNFGLFADYRVSELEDDNGKTTAEDVRAGLRFRF